MPLSRILADNVVLCWLSEVTGLTLHVTNAIQSSLGWNFSGAPTSQQAYSPGYTLTGSLAADTNVSLFP